MTPTTSTVPTVLDERFRAAAAASGDLDVAYDLLDDTPIGSLIVGVSELGLCRVGFDPEPEVELERLGLVNEETPGFESVENAMALDIAMGGSTNTVLHLLAAAREAGVDFDLDDL